MSGAHRVMGIVNVTPDSFSDGGMFLDPGAAVEHGVRLVEEGAHMLDVGGESTRPGAEPVDADEELRRVLPVVEGLAARGVNAQISIDTSKAAVARAALGAGAALVNDVTALRGDPRMAQTVAESGAEVCLMHMLGEPRTMQAAPRYGDVVDEVKAFLEERLAFAVGEGIAEERILLDPGIGFGKTVEHNLALLRRLREIAALGRPVVIGTSRKSFLGRIARAARAGAADSGAASEGKASRAGAADGAQGNDPHERLAGTIATNVMALERGASVFRVHDVAPVADALAVTESCLQQR